MKWLRVARIATIKELMDAVSEKDLMAETNRSRAETSPRTHTFLICVLLVLATAFAIWPLAHSEFINYDDQDYVTENPHVQAGLTWDGFKWAFQTNHASNWHPLTWLSHMLDVQLFGKGPMGPHCINLLFHALNSLLLFFLLRQMTGAQWPSAIVAALFALHPLHVESVAWIAERKDMLGTFFGLLALLFYVAYAKRLQAAGRDKRSGGSAVRYLLALLFFACSLMSKAMLVTLPFLLLLLDYWPLARFKLGDFRSRFLSVRRIVYEKIPFFALSLASSIITLNVQKTAMQPALSLSLIDRIGNALVAYAKYLGKIFWPANLALPYLHPGHWPAAQVAFAAVLIAAVSVAAWKLRERWRYLFLGWFWFIGMLIPVIGLVQVGVQSMADRYTYFSAIGIFIIVIWGGAEFFNKGNFPRPAQSSLALSILGVCGLLAHRQASYWHDSGSLFAHSAAVTHDNYIALANVGVYLYDNGRVDDAITYYREAVRINPSYADAQNNLGAALAAKGSYEEAIPHFRQALINGAKDDAGTHYSLGLALAMQNNWKEAIQEYTQTLQLRTNAETEYNLGYALLKDARPREAIEHLDAALNLHPQFPLAHYNLACALNDAGQREGAISHLETALQLKPDYAEARQKLKALGVEKPN